MNNQERNAVEYHRQVASAILRFCSERTAMIETPLLDLPTKLTYGNYAVYHVLPALIAHLESRGLSAEDVGKRLKVLGVPVGCAAVSGFVWCYELGRLQRYIDAGWPEKKVDIGDREEAVRVLDWLARVSRVYRNDGKLLPEEDGAAATMSILDEATVQDVARRARSNGRPKDIAALRRASAQLEAFIFALNAEARDGIFNHGPYPLGDGTVLVVKELTNLQARFLPWITKERWLPVSKVVVAMVMEGVECRFDMFGGLYTAPHEYLENVVGLEILGGDALTPMTEGDLSAIAKKSQDIKRDLFREFVGWDERQKVHHAAPQYANDFAQLMEIAGYSDPDIRRLLIEPAEAAARQYLDRFMAGQRPAVWEHLGSGRNPIFPELF